MESPPEQPTIQTTSSGVLIPRAWVWAYVLLMALVMLAAVVAYVAYNGAVTRLQGNADLMAEVEMLRHQNRAVAELEYELRQLRDMQERMLGLAGIKPALAASKELEAAAQSSRLVWPVEGVVRVEFNDKTHPSVEIGTPAKQPIAAAGDGVVAGIAETDSLGVLVHLDHGDGFRTRYAGLQLALVAQGDSVDAGQVIGLVGTSGTKPPRLVFQVLYEGSPVNPRDVVRETFPNQ